MIIDHCINQTESEKTASDYGYNKMSLEELERLLGEYEFIDNKAWRQNTIISDYLIVQIIFIIFVPFPTETI